MTVSFRPRTGPGREPNIGPPVCRRSLCRSGSRVATWLWVVNVKLRDTAPQYQLPDANFLSAQSAPEAVDFASEYSGCDVP
jgi:hypothetical protein